MAWFLKKSPLFSSVIHKCTLLLTCFSQCFWRILDFIAWEILMKDLCVFRQKVCAITTLCQYIKLQASKLSRCITQYALFKQTGMDVEDLHHEITKTLPELQHETRMTLVAHLKDVTGVRSRSDLGFVGTKDISPFLTPIQSRKLIHAFKNDGQVVSSPSDSHLEHSVSPPVNLLPEALSLQANQISLLPSHCQPLSSNQNTSSWISSFEVPWDKMPARLLQAMERGDLAQPEDRRTMIRAVVEAIQVHCRNPNKAACAEVAKAIVSKYPGSLADKTGEGEQLGCGYYSLLRQLKTTVEHVNRDNVSHRLRQPRKRSSDDSSGDDVTSKRGRTEADTYGCTKWQPTVLAEGETSESLEVKRKTLVTIFKSAGPTAVDKTDVKEYMEITYIYQRHMINTWPPPSLCEIKEQWPLLFTKRGLCSHFQTLTNIDDDMRLREAFVTKGKRILTFFQTQRLKWNKDVLGVLREMESPEMNNHQIAIAANLLLMKFFQEQDDQIFILTDGTKCTAKVGTSRKTGRVVQRKVTSISSRVTTFLQRLTEFEWKTSN
ncbi:uncharacterized protein LOC117944981 [Etheostoma cragini]|uniref:uncharacterized protein LOC117944981 n=1 Tax=Etheostoma cragini TaxID=417921 RepID=UPI00155E7D92|nr:uncharacterized protein LOC117944981 [Etheostoma cragini]